MALISCPECGQMISDKAYTCVHCGYPLKEQQQISKKMINAIIHRKSKTEYGAIVNVVSVDGTQVGSINNGETYKFSITPGIHNITIKGTGTMWPVADAFQQVNVKEDGDLYIEIDNKSKTIGCSFVEITSIVQK